MFRKTVFLVIVFPVLLFHVSNRNNDCFQLLRISACDAGEKAYLSQTYIDSSIQSALFMLNDAASVAGVGFKMHEALAEAKRIARELREMAKGDPNEKYVNWKVGELEMQIFLEEKDMLLDKMKQNTGEINQIIAQFNAEIGKNRPDFERLHSLHMTMSGLNTDRANAMASAFNRRTRNISREVAFALEKGIMTGDLEQVRDDAAYCELNQEYLNVPKWKIRRARQSLEGMAYAGKQRHLIKDDFEKAELFLKKGQLSNVREIVISIEGRLAEIKKDLRHQEWNSLNWKAVTLQRHLEEQEDSLVRENLKILDKHGEEEASDYLQSVLKKRGVSNEKIAYVDRAILEIGSPGEDNAVSREIESVVGEAEQSGFDMADLRSMAVKRVQEKADSIKKAEERQKLIRQKQEWATLLIADIYSYLEKNEIQLAYDEFKANGAEIKKYIWSDAFEILETTVKEAYKSRDIMVQPETVAYLEDGNYKDNVSWWHVFDFNRDKRLKKKREEAKQTIVEIYTMMEKNEIFEAYEQFMDKRKKLKKYLDREAFDLLATSVIQAYQYTQGKEMFNEQ